MIILKIKTLREKKKHIFEYYIFFLDYLKNVSKKNAFSKKCLDNICSTWMPLWNAVLQSQ